VEVFFLTLSGMWKLNSLLSLASIVLDGMSSLLLACGREEQMALAV
jgi:hypothetical protein